MVESFGYFAGIVGGIIILYLIFRLRGAIFNILFLIIFGAMIYGGNAMLTQVGGGVGTLGIFLILIGVGLTAATSYYKSHQA